jgi:hypothetical protein
MRRISTFIGTAERIGGALGFLALGACAAEPSVDELISEPVVATKFDPQVDFGTFDTFAVHPTVSVVRDVGDGGTLSPDTAAELVDRITTNMSSRGYRLVATSDRPSLGIQATVYLQIGVATASYGGYWWGVPGYAGAPSYWGYPYSQYYAPWSYATAAYKSGTLIVECIDLRDAGTAAPDASVGPPGTDAGATGRLEVVWSIYAHAVAGSLLSSLSPDALSAIDQGFDQSPYLQRREGSSQ